MSNHPVTHSDNAVDAAAKQAALPTPTMAPVLLAEDNRPLPPVTIMDLKLMQQNAGPNEHSAWLSKGAYKMEGGPNEDIWMGPKHLFVALAALLTTKNGCAWYLPLRKGGASRGHTCNSVRQLNMFLTRVILPTLPFPTSISGCPLSSNKSMK
ncbi:unnamed protein product [Merluccius merluccius]